MEKIKRIRPSDNSPLAKIPFGGLTSNMLRTIAVLLMLSDHVWATAMSFGNWMTYIGRTGLNIYPDKTIFPLGVENKILAFEGIKDAIIVAGADREHKGYDALYLFVVLEEAQDEADVICRLKEYIKTTLPEEEQPKDIFVINKKPMSRFKTDRRYLQQKYNLF